MSAFTLVNHLDQGYLRDALAADARTAFTAEHKWLPPKWFYDAEGSALFTKITQLPEYYPTRRELAILRARGAEVAAATGAETLVELGSGTSDKTEWLLSELSTAGTLRTYVPVDVDAGTLTSAAHRLIATYQDLSVYAVCADFEVHLKSLVGVPPGEATGRRLVAFLGGTIGNLTPAARAAFLAGLRATMAPGDGFLLGADLVKDPRRLVAAYDDAAGVTAEFNRNVLRVLNRELRAGFEPEAFEHVAIWDEENEWIEMRLRAMRDMTVGVEDLDLAVSFAEGEEMRTEISAKFRRAGLEDELRRASFTPAAWYTDPAGDFALSLSFA
ncbi:L-histidine N(alpha)-methyltransferase [Rhizohabitans arisaemae]|uniref:L-histidine N(alpha)-methyltransferase n=1 Tax=Rhizohabitans arisaemae TaxID=2720610 RepID=UPI0024B224BE|nr:L-histidine N(alpha)-methyltransferase [Rhizohabitans arisaemae]